MDQSMKQKKKPQMKTPKFELVKTDDNFHDDHWTIKISDGSLSGVHYQYDTVSVNELGDDEGMELKFNTITIENPDNG